MSDLGQYVILYLAAFLLSVFLVPAVRRLAIRVGALDQPDRVRKIHTEAVPRMGGVAIFIAFIVPVVGAYVVGWYWFPESRLFIVLREQMNKAAGLLGAALLMLALGIYDDLRHASPRLKLLVQALAGVILCAVGITISSVREPFTGQMIEFGWWAYPLTVFWVMAVTNAINLIDGMDGLGPGVGLFVAGTMFVVSLFYNTPLVSTVTSVLVGAIIGFLIFNFHPAKIFMGDSGSLFIGSLLAGVAVQGSVKRALLVPVIALALPIVDTTMAIVRRWSRGLPMSVPDKQHVHHRLIQAGFSQRQAVFILYGACTILGCAALVVALLESRLAVGLAYGFIVAAIGASVYVLGWKDVTRLVRRTREGWKRRRVRDKAWTQVYISAAKLQGVESLEQMWQEVTVALEALEVDAVRVRVVAAGAPVRVFGWARPGAGSAVTADNAIDGWTLRLPLAEEGPVGGEMLLHKDTRRGPMPEALGEMVDVLRAELLKAVARLTMLKPSAAETTPTEAPVA